MEKIKQRNLAEQIYKLCRQSPQGKVTTYREIAAALGTKGYQAIGQVLKKNPDPGTVPCFKIVKSTGEIGGYCGSDLKNISMKIEKLQKEGIVVREGKVDLGKCLFRF